MTLRKGLHEADAFSVLQFVSLHEEVESLMDLRETYLRFKDESASENTAQFMTWLEESRDYLRSRGMGETI